MIQNKLLIGNNHHSTLSVTITETEDEFIFDWYDCFDDLYHEKLKKGMYLSEAYDGVARMNCFEGVLEDLKKRFAYVWVLQ